MAKKFNIKAAGLRTVGVAGGAVVGTVIDKPLAKVNPKVRGIGKIVLGAVLPSFVPKMPIMQHVGDGLIAVGAVDLAKEFVPSLEGIGEKDYMDTDLGYIGEDVDELSGTENDMSMGTVEGNEDISVGDLGEEERDYL